MFVSDAQARLHVAREHADELARDYRAAQRADDGERLAVSWPERLPARARHLLKRLAAAAALLGAVAAVVAPGAGATAKAGGTTCSVVSRGGPCRLANVLTGGPFAFGGAGRKLTGLHGYPSERKLSGLHGYLVSPSVDRGSTLQSPIFCCRPVSQ